MATAAGDDGDLVVEFKQVESFILMPTGTEADPSGDAWPVADVRRPAAGAAFGGVCEMERAFNELDSDSGTGGEDDPLDDFVDELREHAFFAPGEASIRSRVAYRWIKADPPDAFRPYWHGASMAQNVADIPVSGPWTSVSMWVIAASRLRRRRSPTSRSSRRRTARVRRSTSFSTTERSRTSRRPGAE